jgi:hypothetical protein
MTAADMSGIRALKLNQVPLTVWQRSKVDPILGKQLREKSREVDD